MRIWDTHFHFYGEAAPPEFMAALGDDLGLLREHLPVPPEELEFRLLSAGADYVESLRAMECANVVENAFLSCGVHPHQADEFLAKPEDFSVFRQEKKLLAIGEIGLDYYYEGASRVAQIEVFDRFLQMALQWKLPAMLHLRDKAPRRDAYKDALELLTPFARQGGRFVVHCCTAAPDDVAAMLELGAMIGVTGIITFRGADDVREMLKIVPDERILIETDSPYLAPVPFRGRENTPAMVTLAALKLAEQRQRSFADMVAQTTANAEKFYLPSKQESEAK